MYYSTKFDQFLRSNNIGLKNKDIKAAFYPLLIRIFINTVIDKEILNHLQNVTETVLNTRMLSFHIASYIKTKLAMYSIDIT